MRLPMKPSQLPATTGTLPILLATATAAASVAGAVAAASMISTSFMTLAGEKK